jgi:hypothetical protein
MMSVLIYSIPRDIKNPLLPIVSPYMWITSQWQLWNLFAPDPLRRVTAYEVDVRQGNIWQLLTTIDAQTYPWWRHAAQWKLIGNVLDPYAKREEPAKRFLQSLCAPFHVAAGTRLRVQYDTYVIPLITTPQSRAWWEQWQPKTESSVGIETTCPAAS